VPLTDTIKIVVLEHQKCLRVDETLRDSLFHSFQKQSADETSILTTGGPAAEIAISQIFFFLIFAKISTEPKSHLFKRPLGEILPLTIRIQLQHKLQQAFKTVIVT